MKKNNTVSFFLVLLFLLVGCKSEPELPVVPFALAKLNSFEGEFNLADMPNAFVSWEVAFYDEEDGASVSEYAWSVVYRDVSHGVISNSVNFETIVKSMFLVDADGRSFVNRTWTLNEVANIFELTLEDIDANDEFIFSATLLRSDGTLLDKDNPGHIDPSIPFDGFYEFTMIVTCEMEDLSGVMDVTTIGWCGEEWTGQVELVKEDGLIYPEYSIPTGQYDFGAYIACYGATSTPPCDPNGAFCLRLSNECGKLRYRGVSQWGETYFIHDLILDGPHLTIDWSNDYAPEAGVSTLPRTDGKDWPSLRF